MPQTAATQQNCCLPGTIYGTAGAPWIFMVSAPSVWFLLAFAHDSAMSLRSVDVNSVGKLFAAGSNAGL